MHRRTIIVVSLGAHAALALALFAAGIWHLQRLDAGRRRFDLAVAAPPPPPPAGSAPAARPPTIVPKVHRRIVHDPVQPTVRSEVEVVPDVGAAGSGAGSGAGPGDGPGSGSGTCLLPSCGIVPAPPQPPAQLPQVAQPPPTLPPHVLQALRISGETQIEPPDEVKIAMQRDGRSRTTATFVVCLDTAGGVHEVRAIRGSGYPAYDQRLAEAMFRWRYRPYRVAGQAVPACGVVRFEYASE